MAGPTWPGSSSTTRSPVTAVAGEQFTRVGLGRVPAVFVEIVAAGA